jgi:XTP/dITP diphosphohydrolase
VVTGNITGFIIPHKKGNAGFGYDPFFIPLHSKKTFAEMGNKEKMKLSHRFEAFKILSAIQK